jgi:antitoxin HicB
MKRVEDYLSLYYRRTLYRDDDGDYIAEVEGLPGCVADGPTPAEALDNLGQAMRSWIGSRIEAGLEIYEPSPTEHFSGKLLVRLPKDLHRKLTEQSRAEAVSLNQYLVSRLAEAAAASPGSQAVQGEQYRRPLHELEGSKG